MKTVHPTDMVAHLWAHQSQSNARNASSSTSFDGPVFYSYRTPVAMLHETKGGRRVALITSDGYSVTTKSKHLSAVWSALRDVSTAFRVPYVGAYGGMAPSRAHTFTEAHAVNVMYLVDEYRKLCGTHRRAASIYLDGETAAAARLESEAQIVRDYCDAFALDVPALDPADDARVIWRAREIRAERDADPATLAKREKARAATAARKAKKEARERAARFERDAIARERFRAGQNWNMSAYGVRDERGGALLRYDAADDTIRTSLGASVPAADARAVFPTIARMRERGIDWHANGLQPPKLGAFRLNEIMADGTIRAGCHTIHWAEIEACARALGLLA